MSSFFRVLLALHPFAIYYPISANARATSCSTESPRALTDTACISAPEPPRLSVLRNSTLALVEARNEMDEADTIKELGDKWQIYYKHPDRLPHWPKITKIRKEDSSDMFARLISTPPLGQATVLEKGQRDVTFTVCLELDRASEKSWDVALWFNAQMDLWKEQAFTLVENQADIVS
jgi:hypothetical protein